MAAKKGASKTAKKAAKKAAKKVAKKAGNKAGPMMEAPLWTGGANCTTEELCKYLTDLGKWLTWFTDDYKKLRKAVCNVEKKAWNEAGATMAKRFCTPGPNDPLDPVRPPIWT